MERPPLTPEDWARRAERFLEQFDPMMNRLSEDDLKQALIEMIERGLNLQLAKEVATQKGLELDADITPAS